MEMAPWTRKSSLISHCNLFFSAWYSSALNNVSFIWIITVHLQLPARHFSSTEEAWCFVQSNKDLKRQHHWAGHTARMKHTHDAGADEAPSGKLEGKMHGQGHHEAQEVPGHQAGWESSQGWAQSACSQGPAHKFMACRGGRQARALHASPWRGSRNGKKEC